MFYTWPEAKLPNLSANPTQGEHTWRWIELALALPLFLLHIRLKDKDSELDRHLLFSELDEALKVIGEANPNLQIICLSLMSPSYMNGSDTFQLEKISEIWRDKKTRAKHKFILSSGQSMSFDFLQRDGDDQEMEFLLRL